MSKSLPNEAFFLGRPIAIKVVKTPLSISRILERDGILSVTLPASTPEKEVSPEKEILDKERLGGAYAEEEKIRRRMEEVEVEGNTVNLKSEEERGDSENNRPSTTQNPQEGDRAAA